MATFAYKAVDTAGVPQRGETEASSADSLTAQLRDKGMIVLEIAEKTEPFAIESIFERFKSINMRNLSVMSRQFATLVGSGMPMLRSLYTLEDQTEDEFIKNALSDLRKDVEAGSSLNEAMQKHPGVFDVLYRSMVQAGEESGRLETALSMVADQLEKLDNLRRQVRSAMAYPLAVLALAIIVMLIVVGVVVPVFVGIFEDIAADYPDKDTQLPLMTKIVVTASDFVTGRWYVILLGPPAMIWAFSRWRNSDQGRRAWDRFKLNAPMKVGPVVQKIAIARWSRVFSGTIGAGVPILRAIRIAGETTGNSVIEDAMDEVYESVKKGGTIHGPIERHPVFPAMVSHMVSVGEDSGQLEEMLDKVADFYEAEVDAQVKALTSLIEPIMIMFIGAVVGFIVIAMYLPIFKLYNSIG